MTKVSAKRRLAAIVHELRLLLGIERNTTSHVEKIVSALGAFVGILAIYWGMRWCFPHGFLHTTGTLLMVTSMGATAVLLFAVPQGALSQPWAVLGGHGISAIIGVACQQFFPDQTWTAALAVGLSVGAMYYLRCIHPPGGATALAAVLGGAEIHQLGFLYLVTPVLVNLLFILATAVVFNGFFPWRRYPVHLSRRVAKPTKHEEVDLTQEDFAAAMSSMNSYLDINSETLTQLLELAKQHAEQHSPHPASVEPGRYYSNGRLGNLWSIRQVIDAAESAKPAQDKVTYKVVAGANAFETGVCLRSDFRQWARFEVRLLPNGHWLKLGSDIIEEVC